MSGKCHDILHRPDIPEPIVSKDKTKVCKCCHHRFTQVWDGKLGKYSSFDLCPECRLEKQNEKVSTYVVNYTPFEYQKKNARLPCPFPSCGRRYQDGQGLLHDL